MLLLKDCIKNLKAFKAEFGKQYGITKLGIFGSVARQENREDSDIDIVVEVNHPSLRLMYELEEALKDLFGCKVDLIRFRETLRPLFKNNLQKDVIYVWHSDQYEYANIDEEIIVSAINEDLLPLKVYWNNTEKEFAEERQEKQ